eukprot:Skav205481  [mRNA]  locus=scaffold830:300923:301150:- [translate_table: standard]
MPPPFASSMSVFRVLPTRTAFEKSTPMPPSELGVRSCSSNIKEGLPTSTTSEMPADCMTALVMTPFPMARIFFPP